MRCPFRVTLGSPKGPPGLPAAPFRHHHSPGAGPSSEQAVCDQELLGLACAVPLARHAASPRLAPRSTVQRLLSRSVRVLSGCNSRARGCRLLLRYPAPAGIQQVSPGPSFPPNDCATCLSGGQGGLPSTECLSLAGHHVGCFIKEEHVVPGSTSRGWHCHPISQTRFAK